MPLSPYTPALYLPRNLGRFRSYPHRTITPIPGAGYRADHLVWADQELNLWGRYPGYAPTRYGNYHRAPLLGLGQAASSPSPQDVLNAASLASQIITNPDATLSAQGPKIVTALDKYVLGPILADAAAASVPYLLKYVMPVFAGLYLVSGLAAFYAYQANKSVLGKRGVAANAGRRAAGPVGSMQEHLFESRERAHEEATRLRDLGWRVSTRKSGGYYIVTQRMFAADARRTGIRNNRRRSKRSFARRSRR